MYNVGENMTFLTNINGPAQPWVVCVYRIEVQQQESSHYACVSTCFIFALLSSAKAIVTRYT
jgi:hypothetical protein